jgi:hypothetical protein
MVCFSYVSVNTLHKVDVVVVVVVVVVVKAKIVEYTLIQSSNDSQSFTFIHQTHFL